MGGESSTAASARRQHVIKVAISVFLRYGYAHTTLADIAKAAGLARTALYLVFSDKEAIFSAVVETMVAEKLSDIRRGLPEKSSFEPNSVSPANPGERKGSNWCRLIQMQGTCSI
jgi:AcrR family transcriptional regulator